MAATKPDALHRPLPSAPVSCSPGKAPSALSQNAIIYAFSTYSRPTTAVHMPQLHNWN